MGSMKFRKSVKIAPGVKVNFNKKSVGLTVGPKGAKYTVNSSGRKTATVGIPGTGLYYSESSGGGSKKRKSSSSTMSASDFAEAAPIIPKSDLEKAAGKLSGNKRWMIFQFVLIFFALLGNAYVPALLFGGIAFYLHQVRRPKLEAVKAKEEKFALGLQQILTGDSSETLTLLPSELTSRAYAEYNLAHSAVESALAAMKKAKEPVTYFESYGLAVQNAEKMAQLEPYLSFKDTKPSQLLSALEADKDEMFMEFIEKYFDDTKAKAASLVTDKGRNGRFQRYYDSLVPYFKYLSQECINYIENTYSDNFVK